MTLEELGEIEAIKQLKARYFRYLDTKQWDQWGDVFTEDAELVNPQSRDVPLKGRQEIVRTVSTNLADIVSVHHGHMPEIELLSPTTARGVWSMFDLLVGRRGGARPDEVRLEGYGHYVEQYRKDDDGRWRIARLQLMRLHVVQTNHVRVTDPSVFWS
jgi:ketosteroid isomerase-like protein